MNLVVITSKRFWWDQEINKYVSTGGFPIQMIALAELFDRVDITAMLSDSYAPKNGVGNFMKANSKINLIREPKGNDLYRKISLLIWLPKHFRLLWTTIKNSDCVHTPVPGDIGVIAIVITMMQNKPLFVRHCGTWGIRKTLADKLLYYFLPKIAKKKNIIMATGGGTSFPENKNKRIKWIFSTSFSKKEWQELKICKMWNGKSTLNIISVGRLSKEKNVESIIMAVDILKTTFPIHLDVVGDGEELSFLVKMVSDLGLDPHVTFYGNRNHDQVMSLFSKSHLFVFPTRTNEGFPKVLLEAMACGLPSVCSRVSVIPSLIENKCGIILKNTKPKTIANAIKTITSNQIKLKKMGCKARQISQRYSLEVWRDKIGKRLEKKWGRLITH